ncbi:MAG: DUF3592 domain-containing protein [Myxococcaceae bacterium]|nr:DUF3592 domain-containing protein [Myxococcaceae bacterium]
MQLAIPHAPRPASLSQVPGAVRRVALVALACAASVLLVAMLARVAERWVTEEARFLDGAGPVTGTVVRVDRPKSERSAWPVAVIYALGASQQSATIEVDVAVAERLGKGGPIELLVRPESPSQPRERNTVEGRASRSSLMLPLLGVVVVAAVLVLVRELRRAMRREVEPLRTGLLVWLTPDAPLPEARGPFAFPAHYFREDVKHAVVARADGRRRPVKNGEKLLAAVAPREPTWVRVVDEEVAQRLGWYR